MRLQGRLIPVADVTPARRDALFALMDRHYENVRRPAFDADLDEKQWVILLSDPATDEICGFSTQVVLRTEAEGRPIRALFSGDTIVDRARWGDPRWPTSGAGWRCRSSTPPRKRSSIGF